MAKAAPKKSAARATADGAIEVWAIDKVKPNPLNSREHSDAQVDQLVESFEEFGQVWPVLVDERGVLIAGEGRWRAAVKRDSATIKVIVARNWSVARKRAFIIVDNKLAENSSWNRERLGTEVANLNLMGFDTSLLGFTGGEIKTMIANAVKPSSDPEDSPLPPPNPVSELGDLWLLGGHRVLCGDSTSSAAVLRVLDGAKPHLMVTDPPYGVAYDPAWRGKVKNSDGSQLSTGKNRAVGKVQNDEQADWRQAWFLFPGNVAYVWHSGKHGTEVGVSLEAAKFIIRSQIVWVKNNFVVGRADYHWGHEAAFYTTKQGSFDDKWRFEDEHECAAYAVKLGATAQWDGGRKQSTVWHIDMVKNDTGHGTQKPVECMRRPIVNNSQGGEAVYDPFLGSGTTIIAAHMEGRVCIGLELDPAYVNVIVQRWATFTGLQPVHEATGKTFEEIKADRDGKKPKRPSSRLIKAADKGGAKA